MPKHHLKPEDLYVGLSEIAEIVGELTSAISNWRSRKYLEFPEPWGTWYMGSLWKRSDIEKWYADTEARRKKAKQLHTNRLKAKIKELENGD